MSGSNSPDRPGSSAIRSEDVRHDAVRRRGVSFSPGPAAHARRSVDGDGVPRRSSAFDVLIAPVECRLRKRFRRRLPRPEAYLRAAFSWNSRSSTGSPRGRVRLLVDDRPENLLYAGGPVGRHEPGIGPAPAAARRSPRCLLDRDFAAVLLDVNMPGIGGFETASTASATVRGMFPSFSSRPSPIPTSRFESYVGGRGLPGQAGGPGHLAVEVVQVRYVHRYALNRKAASR